MFVLQPQKDIFYYGKVIQTNLESTDSFIKGMTLIYIYDCFRSEKVVPHDLDEKELLIPPIIVNNRPWTMGYFEAIDNVAVSDKEKNLDIGFWDVLSKKYLDVNGNKIKKLKKKPKYCGIYGLGSYGAVEEELRKVLNS